MDRLKITLDPEQGAKLARLADRMHVQPGTLARSLLSSALDEADPDARNVVELLDRIPARSSARSSGSSGPAPGKPSRSTSSKGPMPRVELAAAAVEDLRTLIRTHGLPADTASRVARSLRPLERFPLLGPELTGRWEGIRFVLGPWRWMLLVYVVLEPGDRGVVVTIQDARSSTAATGF